MNNEERGIAETVFNKFYAEYIEAGASNQEIIANFLPDYIEEVAELWGIDINCTVADFQLDNEKPLLRILFKKDIVVAESGEIYSVNVTAEKTGGVTWNGDDEYIDSMRLVANLKEKIGKSENIKELINSKRITSDDLESAACEILDIIIE